MDAILKSEILAIRNRLECRLEAVMAEFADDPLKEWVAIQEEFKEWLAKTHGEARLAPEAFAAVEDMRRRNDAAKAKFEARDDVKLMDERISLEGAIEEWDRLFWNLRLGADR